MEEKAFENNNEETNETYFKPPGFGDSKTNGEKVHEFYEWWENFTTYQTFAFAEKYNPNQAENRQVRRLIEKENKKERSKEKKNYVKIIKTLVDFVRKRDPRFKNYMEMLNKEQEKKIEEKKKFENEQKILKQQLKKLALQEELNRYEEEEKLKEQNQEIEKEEEREKYKKYTYKLSIFFVKKVNQILNFIAKYVKKILNQKINWKIIKNQKYI